MVRIDDLIDYWRGVDTLPKHKNYDAFCKYTRKCPFPLGAAKTNKFLKSLLREIRY
jgi:hypothetical protein